MKAIQLILANCMLVILLMVSVAWSELSEEEIARLDADLTPMGAVKAGNAEGTIPAWEGGITVPPAGYIIGEKHIDPFAKDKILMTISADNVAKYADKLTVGHKAMLKQYDTFRMNVYRTRRSASAPQRIYEGTLKASKTAKLVEGGKGVTGAVGGIPFPIPQNGIEAIWNHILRWRGPGAIRHYAVTPVTKGGSYELAKMIENTQFLYYREGMIEEELNNLLFVLLNTNVAPVRMAGTISLIHETLNNDRGKRQVWIYKPGRRRVFRAPEISFDNPNKPTDGLTTVDSIDMYNGSPERYNWELVGRREIYIPYNSYKLHSGELKYKDIIMPLHLNSEYLRYELHRVWVVDATLKKGFRHLYKRRTFYIDEDSWQIAAIDVYGKRDELWRVSENHGINFYDVPTFWTTAELHYDLKSGRYAVRYLSNEEKNIVFTDSYNPKEFTPAALRRKGTR